MVVVCTLQSYCEQRIFRDDKLFGWSEMGDESLEGHGNGWPGLICDA